MKEKEELPWQVFNVASMVLPRLMRLIWECGVSPNQFYMLWHVKHFGEDYEGHKVIHRVQAKELLGKVFLYKDKQQNSDINRLRTLRLLLQVPIAASEKKRLFEKIRGNQVLLLTEAGVEKITEFNDSVNKLYAEKIEDSRFSPFKPYIQMAAELAKSVIEGKPQGSHSALDIEPS